MSILDYTIDPKKVDEGDWKPVIGDEDNLSLKLRGRRCEAYKKEQAKKMRKMRRSLGRNQAALVEHVQRIDNECIAEHCLLDWKNFLDTKKQQIPFSEEMAKTLMTDRRYEPFAEIVKEMIDEIDNGYDESEEEVAEKS
jgi:hypothetical protein